MDIAVMVETPETPKGLIFLVHGFLTSSTRPSVNAMAETTLKNGLISVRFDTTHSTGESDGSPENATITSYIEDLEDVVKWAKTQSWFQSPYLISGSSLGGITAIEHAHNHHNDVKAVAALAPVISGALSLQAAQKRNAEKLTEWQQNGFEVRTINVPNPIEVKVPWSHMEDRMKYDVLGYASNMTMPLFLYVGSIDESCPPDQQHMLYKAWGSQKKELIIHEGMPHGLQTIEQISAYKQSLDTWLKSVTSSKTEF